jgi:hypothetical protein
VLAAPREVGRRLPDPRRDPAIGSATQERPSAVDAAHVLEQIVLSAIDRRVAGVLDLGDAVPVLGHLRRVNG